jgi:NADPH-dependent curcumin reductase CurA
MKDVNRQFRLKTRPVGRVKASDFDLVEGAIPEPGPNQVVARLLYLSLDPTNRIWMSDAEGYMPPVGIGEVMRGAGVSQVVASNNPAYKVGDLVTGLVGWQDYTATDGEGMGMLTPIPPGLPVPPSAMLGVLGITGLTAYFGLLEIGKPQAGETVVVSAAAGAVGSIVGQLAKIKGARAVGLAGSREKCEWITRELGFDAAINYKDRDWREQLARACPRGIDVNFENVGGEIMEEVLDRMNLHGRVALCGMISGYNTGERMRGPFDAVLVKRLRVEGFIILDYLPRFIEGAMQMAQWIMEGKLKHRETVVEGLERAPEALNMLFDGANTGKLIVKVADPPLA